MLRLLRPAFLFVSSMQFMLLPGGALSARTLSTPPCIPGFSYEDSTPGLERLAPNIVKAQSQNDRARVDTLLKSLILPNAFDWYENVFDREAADGATRLC
jgi:hypothetical protein